MSDFCLVNHPDLLRKALPVVAAAKELAIDTEFQRERTYYPLLALLQISDGREHFLFDPLAVNLEPLYAVLLANPGRKIMHSGKQDREILRRLSGRNLVNLNDTQIASRFLGQSGEVGLGKLVQELLGITLPKSETVSDWMRRPLSPEQLDYAKDDVAHLHVLHKLIEDRLEADGKLAYYQEECRLLEGEDDSIDNIGERLTHPGDSPFYRAVLMDLAIWREEEARRKDLPRGWILQDGNLKDIARNDSPAIWVSKGCLSVKQCERHKETFLEIIRRHRGLSRQRPQSSRNIDRMLGEALGELKAVVEAVSGEARIPADFLASQRILRSILEESLTNDKGTLVPLKGWRGSLLNERLNKVFLSSKIFASNPFKQVSDNNFQASVAATPVPSDNLQNR